MNMQIKNVMIALSLLSLISCGGNAEVKEKNEEIVIIKSTSEAEIKMDAIEKDGLRLYQVNPEKDYPSAALDLKDPIGKNLRVGPTRFDFVVREYQLQKQTAGERSRSLANSDKGQHIHFIHNNAPYQAKYEPSFEADLLEGNNVVLAFLSKSYHESIKSGPAFYFGNFYIGEGQSDFDKSAQHLFYSIPKGKYSTLDAKKLLIDFYLINTNLTEGGDKVKLIVDSTEFIITDWSAYFLEGLGFGEHSFRIQLLDKDNNPIEGPFNDSGVRKVMILED